MKKKTIQFAMAIHNHQPVGNFDFVFEESYNKAYMPLMECIKRHPKVKVALHNSGPLWDYFHDHKPEWVQLLREMAKQGRLELLSGGYYEPILVNISDRDKISQIKRMNRAIKRESGKRPKGMWCAERVWEPYLAKPIAEAGLKYTILDEAHFRTAGMQERDIFGYYVTEEQGKTLSIFPINFFLRQNIPHGDPQDIIDYLEKWADESGDRLAVFADDGEKFGLWPNSYREVWEEKWLDRFFDLLEENSDWIKPVNFSEYMEANKPLGRVYLPTASYFEMSTWALLPPVGREFRDVIEELKENGKFDDYRSFLSGGFWRNFLVKYPHANRIQKKALHISEKVHAMMSKDKADAETLLYKGQCNCAYWHGVFGGIYLPHLRHAIQECLIGAEFLADEEAHKGYPYKIVQRADVNRDLYDEVLINTRLLQLYFTPADGGALCELVYKPLLVNLTDTMTRRDEIYHDKIRKMQMNQSADDTPEDEHLAKNLDKYLVADKYERYSFVDHFLPDDVSGEAFWTGEYEEMGDFINQPYEIFTSEKDDKAVVTLSRKGSVNVDGQKHAVEVEKTFYAPEEGGTFQVSYWLINNSDEDLELNFAPEMNLSFHSKDPNANYIEIHWEEQLEEDEEELVMETQRIPLTHTYRQEELEDVALVDGHRGYRIDVNFGMEADVLHHPIETVNMKLDGYERVYQQTVIAPVFKVKIDAGDTWDNTLTFSITEAPKQTSGVIDFEDFEDGEMDEDVEEVAA